MKKAIERGNLDAFHRAYSEFPPGVIEESESPAFIIQASGQTHGIEVIEYASSQGENGSFELRSEVLGLSLQVKAATEYSARGTLPVQVWFSLDRYAILTKASLDSTARSLVETVLRDAPQTNPGLIELDAECLKGTPIEGVIDMVRIGLWPDVNSSCWMYHPEVSWVSVEPEELQTLIDRKNSKVAAYLANCDFVWLLIVAAGGMRLASTARLTESVSGHEFRSQFEKVIFFDRERKEVLNVKTRSGDTGRL